jgi:hypothetical protein
LIAEVKAAGLEAMLLPELIQATARFQAVGLVLSLYQPLRLTSDQPDPPSPGKSSELALSPSAADKSLTVAVAALDPADLGVAELTNVDCPLSSKKEVGEKKSDAVREDEAAAEEAAKLEAAKIVCAQLEQTKQEALKSAPEARLEAAKPAEAATPADAAAEEAAAVASGSTLFPQNEQEQGDAVAAVAVSARPDAAAHVAGEALVSKEPGGRQFEFRFDLTMLAVFI